MKVNYAFYPTLLDSYRYYLDNIEDETNFYDLIDKINKVKKDTSEEQEKGVSFESLINELITPSCIMPIGIDDIYSFRSFEFNEDLVNNVYEKLKRSTGLQVFKEKIIDTKYGKVRLYGIFDYEFPEMIADLKTTKSYKSCKYINNFQHKFISLINCSIPYFSYVVTDFKYMFIETYRLTDNLRDAALKEIEDFIQFLDRNKNLITDEKIFGK